ncbi:MAG: MMPL family transporter [Clostridia bacterium]|nr:MMPL family transporter [Clostridia bacterium]
MKLISKFIITKRHWIFAAMLILTVACVFLYLQVGVNTDMTKYLSDNSSMRAGLEIMNEEFPAMETANTVRVMSQGLSDAEEAELLSKLEKIPGVDSVAHDESDTYNKGEYALFVLSTSADYKSDEMNAIEDELEGEADTYNIVWMNDNTATDPLPLYIIIVAIVLAMIVLFLMSYSWIEPILFLAAIGVAVMINMGTNIILGEISNITASIAAILQMVLSMDYSIILINRYRQEKENAPSNAEAMIEAVRHSIMSIASSALTTVAGLLALVFMNFKIGYDLGIVLAKGVFISMICVLLVLPTLILAFDKLIVKTAKKALHIPMGGVARFSHKLRYAFVGLFVLLFGAFYLLQGGTGICFTVEKEDPVAEVFPSDNMLVMVYENEDEEKVAELTEWLESHDDVRQVMGYPNLLGKAYTAEELSGSIGSLVGSMGVELGDLSIDPSLLQLFYYDYYGGTAAPMTVSQFLAFLSIDVMQNPAFAGMIDEEMAASAESLALYADPANLTAEHTPEELAALLSMDAEQVTELCRMTGKTTLSVQEFLNFLVSDVLTNEAFAGQLDDATVAKLTFAATLTDAAVSDNQYTAAELSALLGTAVPALNADTIELLCLYRAATVSGDPAKTMTIEQLVEHLTGSVLTDVRFAAFMTSETKLQVAGMGAMVKSAVKMFKTDRYSRMIIYTTLPQESEKTSAFMDELFERCGNYTGEYHFVGNSSMNYELENTFGDEMTLITVLTSAAIFMIVLISFRSLTVPILLVLIVQCGVYITVAIVGWQGYDIHYMALLIVECILMGATIDYGILFTNYYRDYRSSMSVKDALNAAYHGSIHTITTSGAIIVFVTAIIGYTYSDPTVSQICRTLAIGVLAAVLLILFVLPGMLTAFDRLLVSKKNAAKSDE